MLSTILETSSKSAWSSAFWYVKECTYRKCIQYTIHWDKTQIFGKNRRYKKCPLFSFASSTHHRFIFNLQFLYELKQTVRLSKTMCRVFEFWFHFVFIEIYILTHNSFQFCSQTSNFYVATSFNIQLYLHELELHKIDLVTNFLDPKKPKFWEGLNSNF